MLENTVQPFLGGYLHVYDLCYNSTMLLLITKSYWYKIISFYLSYRSVGWVEIDCSRLDFTERLCWSCCICYHIGNLADQGWTQLESWALYHIFLISLLRPPWEWSYGDSSREWFRNPQLFLRPRLRTGTPQLLTYLSDQMKSSD